MTNVEAIIFDLDETLSDRRTAIDRFMELWIAQYFSDRLHEASYLRDVFRRLDDNGYRVREELYPLLVEELEWNSPPSKEQFIAFWREHFPKCIEPMAHLYEMLDYLKHRGVKLGLITNGPEHIQRRKIDSLGIGDYFHSLLISGTVGIHKPDARIFLQCTSELQVAPERAWYVGDHPVNDVAGSRGAGLVPVWLARQGDWSEDQHGDSPAHTVQTLQELIALYDRLHPHDAY
ncbi:HAD family hydrolase [Paenibacillus xylaniclasticus]|uniref:HAD family hydrolase n=1 Tax=Paenibacillus xylaniclasticus TaxID=588083 RepID=UPI000FDBC8ED|nr:MULTISPECIES: HAD family hydrolase [Paenibacillus]